MASAAAGFLELPEIADSTAQIVVSTPRTTQAVPASTDVHITVTPNIGQAQQGSADILIVDQAFMRVLSDDANGSLQVLGAGFTMQGNASSIVGAQLVNPPLNLTFAKVASQAIDFSFEVPPVSINSIPGVTGGQGGIGPVYEVVVRNNDGAAPHSFDISTTTIFRKLSRRMR